MLICLYFFYFIYLLKKIIWSFNRVGERKPVGILHVKVVRAHKLLKMDIFGTSDPYVKLSLTGEKLPAKKTSIKMNNLNPEWNEKFKFIVTDPNTQVLHLEVYDWDKVFFPVSLFSCLENGEMKNCVLLFIK